MAFFRILKVLIASLFNFFSNEKHEISIPSTSLA